MHCVVDMCVVIYTRSELLDYREGALGRILSFLRRRLDQMLVDGKRRRSHGRVCRAGTRKIRTIHVLVAQRSSPSRVDRPPDTVPPSHKSLIHLKTERHLDTHGRRFRAGRLNISSVGKKSIMSSISSRSIGWISLFSPRSGTKMRAVLLSKGLEA